MNDYKKYDLIVLDHPEKEDYCLIEEIVKKINNPIIITRNSFPQQELTPDPEYKKVFLIDKYFLPSGIEKLLNLEKF